MKILSLGLDNSVLNKNSALAKRTVEYGNLVDKYFIIVPSADDIEIELSQKVKAYGVKSGKKVLGLINIFKLANNLIKREKFDIITVQDQYYLSLIGWLLAKKYNLGLEIQVHGFEKYGRLRKIIARYILPRADAVRVVSRRLERRLVEEFGVEEEKITVVPIYSEKVQSSRLPKPGTGGQAKFKVQSSNVKFKNDKFVFLTVGRLVPVKNVEMQIRAMSKIVKKYSNLELWIVGEGKEKEKFELEIGNWKLEINVKLLGWKNNLDEYYNAADAFVLTSNSEGWGMAVIEAASYGLPIIMTDVGCAGEVIVDGESGIVIPVGDQGKLEESMVKLINSAELRKKLGEGARKTIMNLPNKEETLKLYKKSWEKAIKKLWTNPTY